MRPSHFPKQTFDHLQIEVLDTNVPKRPEYDGVSGVGFAEVTIPGVSKVDELVRPPTDLLDQAGASSIDHPLVELFTRLRSNPAEPVRLDEEVRMNRLARALPTALLLLGHQGPGRACRTYVPDSTIDSLVGIPTTRPTAASPPTPHRPTSRARSTSGPRPPSTATRATFWSGVFNQAI